MNRNRHRTIAALRALEHLQPAPAVMPHERERGALIDFALGLTITAAWFFGMAWWALS